MKENLKNEIIVWHDSTNKNRVLDAKVVECDREMGITIVALDEYDFDDQPQRLTCINGPQSAQWNESKYLYNGKYDELYDTTVDMINKGEYFAAVTDELLDICEIQTLMGGMSDCSFSS